MTGDLSASPPDWDLFCHVVDNFGDVGVCWRLAADLGARGQRVRLWLDDASALRWMAPHGARGVEVRPWDEATEAVAPADIVVEAFGCDPPAGFVAGMAARRPAPVWINLEYLSAEAWVERSHGLPSPQQSGPARGLSKWFFFPGFTAATGGVLREPGLLARSALFDRSAWLAGIGAQPRPGERVVTVFAYPARGLEARLRTALGSTPALLLAAPGRAQAQVVAAAGGPLRAKVLDWLPQTSFDEFLWSSDLAFVRGEDSFVRAQWAGCPFVWQIYPQHDGAHAAKLDAFLDRFLAGADAPLRAAVRRVWHGWNGLGPMPHAADWPDRAAWGAHALAWRDRLAAQADLTSQLMGFAEAKRSR